MANRPFRIQVIRYQSRTGEQSSLFRYPKSASHLVRYLGPLQGLEQLSNPVRTEVAPYLSLRWQNDPWTVEPMFSAGGDFKLTLSPGGGAKRHDQSGLRTSRSGSERTQSHCLRIPSYPSAVRSSWKGQETLDFGLRSGDNDRSTVLYATY